MDFNLFLVFCHFLIFLEIMAGSNRTVESAHRFTDTCMYDTLHHLTEDHMLAIEVGSLLRAEEELRACLYPPSISLNIQ